MKRFKQLSVSDLILGSVFFLEGYRENRELDKSYITLQTTKFKQPNTSIKVAHLSDTQFPRLRVPMNTLINSLINEKPDIILFTGDTIDRTEQLDTTKLPYFLKQITKIAPTFIVSGNHETTHPEYNEWLQIIQNSSAHYLENSVESIKIKGEEINIVGLSNDSTSLPEKEQLKIEPSEETLVLAHHPEKMAHYQDLLKDTSFTTFSGHAHGGQIILPIVGGLLSPDQGFFPEYTDGLYHFGNNQLIVSRGLANSSFPTRINNYPHLIFTTITKQKETPA